ncbi:MAG TPA: MbtH family NRPS accessory protein [Candidatus Angelobacter sp.]|nr:MbtH family NRPS accessory protein [Candidatus Angelobacter sp.]
MSWNDPGKEDNAIYKVVINQEQQYSIWPDFKELPRGCEYAGKSGSKAECLAYVKEVWTDMRPLSLRKKMEEFAKNPPPPVSSPSQNSATEESLVDRLSTGDHSVVIGTRPEKTVKLFKEAIDRDYVHIKFTQTKGGTELGVRIDRKASDFSKADFVNEKGEVHIEGDLTLDYVKVKCVADIDLSTLEGKGHLLKIGEGEIVAA